MLWSLLWWVLGVVGAMYLLFRWHTRAETRMSHVGAFKVVIVGAGFSGLCVGKKLSELGIPYTIYDTASQVGGVWHWNHYPAVACDVPAHLYSFSFEPFYPWSDPYAPGQEIQQYLAHVAKKYRILDHISFNTKVESAHFDEKTGLWTIHITRKTPSGEEKDVVSAQVFISAVGQLNQPSFPTIPGLSSFRGFSFHTAEWRNDIPLENQTLAVIGTGPSCVQALPEVVKIAKKVYVFNRSPAYVIPKNSYKITKLWNNLYEKIPFLLALKRWHSYMYFEILFGGIIQNIFVPEWMRVGVEKDLIGSMNKILKKKENKEHLIPHYKFGCKRFLISDTYLAALEKDNVEVVYDPIEEVLEEGLRTKEKEMKVDGIIYATGFKTNTFLRTLQITSSKSPEGLHTQWNNLPEGYYGISVPNFPNFFMLYGPNTNLGHNSIIFMLECQANYIVDGIKKMIKGDIRSVEIKREVFEGYVRKLRKDLKSTAFADESCKSWYKNEKGDIVNNAPHLTLTYWWKLLSFDLSQYMVN